MGFAATGENLEVRLRSITLYLSLVLLVTSMIDFFITRLVFRVGPDVLSRIADVFASYLAVLGRISLTIEQIVLFVVLAGAAILLLRSKRRLSRMLGIFFIILASCSIILYLPIAVEQAWTISTLLILVAMVTIIGLACLDFSRHHGFSGMPRLVLMLFLGGLVLSFIFPLYYRLYLLVGSVGPISLPYPLSAYLGGIFSVMVTAFMVFAYALLARSSKFTLNYRNFLKAALLPTLLIVPLLYAMMRSFFVTQILGMVVAMSTDLVLTHDLLQGLVVAWWFFLTGVLLLVIKGHYSSNKVLEQEAVGLMLIMSTTFLFNYPYYLMLGIVGLFLVSYPLIGPWTET